MAMELNKLYAWSYRRFTSIFFRAFDVYTFYHWSFTVQLLSWSERKVIILQLSLMNLGTKFANNHYFSRGWIYRKVVNQISDTVPIQNPSHGNGHEAEGVHRKYRSHTEVLLSLDWPCGNSRLFDHLTTREGEHLWFH